MVLEVQATYENGVLKLDKPLPLDEHERVTVLVNSHPSRIWQRATGLQWTGDPEILRKIAEDPDLREPELP
jgi:predicted DNA-binding antitoxin AbrB/MazE fold protein